MRIVIVGGGSFQWVPTLTTDLALTPSLRGAEIVLHDIDAGRLARTAPVVEHVSDLTGANFAVRATTDQREALRGADFVMVNITTGGFESMAFDLDIPWRYGIRQPGGDTMGPGGINRALRNIPVLVGIARNMEALCPDAWLLNLTNPMTALCRSVTKATSIKTVGLCHEVTNFRGVLTLLAGADWNAIDLSVTGVNHVPVVTAIDLGDGRDGMVFLREVLDGKIDLDVGSGLRHRRRRARAPGQLRLGACGPARDEAVLRRGVRRGLRAVPPLRRVRRARQPAHPRSVPGDARRTTPIGATRWNVHYTTIAERERHEARYAADLDKRLGDTEPPRHPSLEMAAPVIDSLVTGRPRTFPLNVPNTGQCADLPLDAVTESMCVVDAEGVHGRTPVQAPPFLAAWLNRIVAAQELTVEAALTGDRDLVHAAMLLDPHAGTLGLATIEQMTDELLTSTSAWLPQF